MVPLCLACSAAHFEGTTRTVFPKVDAHARAVIWIVISSTANEAGAKPPCPLPVALRSAIHCHLGAISAAT